MTLQEALKIGSSADGYIKCTYARIHSTDGYDWSLQRKTYERNVAKTEFESAVSDVNEATVFVQDYPVCVADSINPGSKMVNVYLTDYARNTIQTQLYGSKGKQHDIPYQFTKALDGTWEVKEVAIDWIPTDVVNAVIMQGGIPVDLQEALEAAKKKVDNAKALLALAGTTLIF